MRTILSCLLLGAVATVWAEDSAVSGVQGPAREKRSSYVTTDCPQNAIYVPSIPQAPAPPVICPPGTRAIFPMPRPRPQPLPASRECLAWVDSEGTCHVNNRVYQQQQCIDIFGQDTYDDWTDNTVRKRRSVPAEVEPGSELQGEAEEPLSRERRRSPTGGYPDVYPPGSSLPGAPGSSPGYRHRYKGQAPGSQPRYKRRSPTGNRYPNPPGNLPPGPEFFEEWPYPPESFPPGSPGSSPGYYDRYNSNAPGSQPRYKRRSPTGNRYPNPPGNRPPGPEFFEEWPYPPESFPPGSPGSSPGYYDRYNSNAPGSQPRYKRRSPVAPYPYYPYPPYSMPSWGPSPPGPSYVCVPNDV